jgi:xylulokinase
VGQRWTVSASSLAGASVLQWVRQLLSDECDSVRTAGDKSLLACEDGLFFLPFIHGERCPVYAPEASAAFLGLRSHHTAADMLEASKEGIGFLLRMCWEIISELAEGHGQVLAAPVISGGGSADLHWVQLLADILGCELRHVEAGYAGCLGAAMLAGVGCGIFVDASDAVAKVSLGGQCIEPSESVRSRLSACYADFREIIELHMRSRCAPEGA